MQKDHWAALRNIWKDQLPPANEYEILIAGPKMPLDRSTANLCPEITKNNVYTRDATQIKRSKIQDDFWRWKVF